VKAKYANAIDASAKANVILVRGPINIVGRAGDVKGFSGLLNSFGLSLFCELFGLLVM
jgi:hypothetical protein